MAGRRLPDDDQAPMDHDTHASSTLPDGLARSRVVARYAVLRAAHREVFEGTVLVEPTGAFFPDEFAATADGVGRLLRRTMTYAPLPEGVDVELAFLSPDSPEAEAGGAGCGTGACGSGGAGGGIKLLSGVVTELPNGAYRVPIAIAEVGDPILLTAALARAVGGMVLRQGDDPVDTGASNAFAEASEIAAVAAGLGIILLGGACVYRKSCGGLRSHRGTALDVGELALATALFCAVHDQKASTVRRNLEVTQREAFDDARNWLASHRLLVAQLRTAPELLTTGTLPKDPNEGSLGRVLGRMFPGLFRPRELGGEARHPAPRSDLASAAASGHGTPHPRKRSPAEVQRLEETRALVEEALRGR